MTEEVDYLVVGAGLTGATIARLLVDAGREVLVLEARAHVGGNVADAVHPCGIRYSLHGPHYFRTSSARIEAFAKRFADFYPYAAVVMTLSSGKLFHWPLHRAEVEHLVTPDDRDRAGDAASRDNFEARMLSLIPREIYARFIRGYTIKQWGVDPATLDADLASRIELRDDGDIRLSRARFQVLPSGGFSAWVDRMLRGVEVRTGCDFHAADVRWRRRLIYTGPIDRFFGYANGPLRYRTQRRDHVHYPGEGLVQPCGQVNVPALEDGAMVRSIEWRHMLAPREDAGQGSLVTIETPADARDWTEAEYPFPARSAGRHYTAYRGLADARPDVLFCGRLGEYRYLDMDQAIARAMTHAARLLKE